MTDKYLGLIQHLAFIVNVNVQKQHLLLHQLTQVRSLIVTGGFIGSGFDGPWWKHIARVDMLVEHLVVCVKVQTALSLKERELNEQRCLLHGVWNVQVVFRDEKEDVSLLR